VNITHHAAQRMSQRAISRRLVEFALRHGRIEGNKHVLDRNESRKLIAALTEELRLAKRALDKGGVTVVEGDDTVITTYNLQSTPAKRNHGHSHSHGAPSHV
jgi:RNA binding exosome subunit